MGKNNRYIAIGGNLKEHIKKKKKKLKTHAV